MGRHAAALLTLAFILTAGPAIAQTTGSETTPTPSSGVSGAASQPPNRTRIYKVPIPGPELDGVIARPDTPVSLQAVIDPGKEKGDEAFGAYQRGYFLTAFKLALPRAETGDPAAQTLIAELYWNGFGISQDRKKAAEWYRFAADGGNREAQFFYANMLLRGDQVAADKQLGEAYMRKSAKSGHPRALFNVGQIITAKRPTWAGFKSALPYYQKSAEAGVPDAQFALATIYSEAMGVPYNDEQTALNWLQKAANGGLDTAQIELGIWLANGRAGDVDLFAARYWFTRAAAQGNVIAQNRLAHMFATGTGVDRDPVRASAWHILSRRAGFSDSQLDRIFQDLSDIDKKRALEAANQLDRRTSS